MGTPLVIRFKERQDSRIERRDAESAADKEENEEEKSSLSSGTKEKKQEAYGHRTKSKETK